MQILGIIIQHVEEFTYVCGPALNLVKQHKGKQIEEKAKAASFQSCIFIHIYTHIYIYDRNWLRLTVF